MGRRYRSEIEKEMLFLEKHLSSDDLKKYVQLRELGQAREEAASSYALEMPVIRRKPAISKKVAIPLLLSLIIITIGAIVWFVSMDSATRQEHALIVDNVQALATLATAKAHVKTVIEEEDNKLFGKDIPFNFPGTKRKLLVVVPGTVVAGVDLSSITSEQIILVDETNEIKVTLPHATFIEEPSLLMDKVQTFSAEGIFREEVTWDEGFDLAARAQTQIKEESIALGILDMAEENAVNALNQFFTELGYTKVTVLFE